MAAWRRENRGVLPPLPRYVRTDKTGHKPGDFSGDRRQHAGRILARGTAAGEPGPAGGGARGGRDRDGDGRRTGRRMGAENSV